MSTLYALESQYRAATMDPPPPPEHSDIPSSPEGDDAPPDAPYMCLDACSSLCGFSRLADDYQKVVDVCSNILTVPGGVP